MGRVAPSQDLLREAAQQYKDDGYLIARSVLPRSQVLQVGEDMHELVRQQLRLRKLPISAASDSMHQDLQALFKADLPNYIATLTLCAKLTSLWELYLHPSVRDLMRAIGIELPVFQTAPVLHLMSHALKIPDGYQGVGVHQDWPTLQGALDTVTLWLPFADVDRNLFPLELIPRSHLGGLYSCTRRANIFEVAPDCYDQRDFVPIEAHCGDILLMSSFTLHRSGMQGDDRLRLATSFRYENAAEPQFIARAYPFAQKRTVIPDLITPNFPTPQQVRSLFQ